MFYCNRNISSTVVWYFEILVQYTLANPNSSVPMIEKIVRISEFVPISEITLIKWGINYKKFEVLEY